MASPNITSYFVYGTLKTAHLRAGLWPRKPVKIEAGVIQADLFDLGPYPAAVTGDGWLLGEIWSFSEVDMQPTVEMLDRIEGYSPAGTDNEYTREIVSVEFEEATDQPRSINAFAYFYARKKRLSISRRIEPSQKFLGRFAAAWPDSLSRVPTTFSEE